MDEIDKQIQEHIAAAYAALQSAEELAVKHKRSFNFTPAYGMGGWFVGDPEQRNEYSDDCGWAASSRSC